MKKVLSKIANYMLNILICLVFVGLVFASYSFIQLKILNKKYVNYFGYTYFEILTGSMEDEINIDDYVFVKITKDVKENDIISFYASDEVITHRIIKISDDEIITKGDANNAEDKPITNDDVIGKVVYVGSEYGKFIKVITEPIVLVSFFSTVVLFYLAFSLDDGEGVREDES